MAARRPHPAHHPASLSSVLPAGVRARRYTLPPLPIADETIIFFLQCSEFASADRARGAWIGWQLAQATRRSVTNAQHLDEVEAALRSAMRRGVIVALKDQRGDMWFALPAEIPEGSELVSDRIVLPKRRAQPEPAVSPSRPPSPSSSPSPPAPPPPPPKVLVTVVVDDMLKLAKISPFASSLLFYLRAERQDKPKTRFSINMYEVGTRIGWPQSRVEAATRALVRRGYLVPYGRDISLSNSSSGSYIFGSRAFTPSEVHP